jgi:hypothetical protein
MKSKEIIEVVAYDLSNNECTALLIRNSINSLNRALVALHNEEVIEMMKELGVEGVK